MSPWSTSATVMLLSFPALCGLLLCYVHGVVVFGRTILRPHAVTFRPIRTRVMDWLLILRFAWANRIGSRNDQDLDAAS